MDGYKFFAVVGDWWIEEVIGFKQPYPAWFARQVKLDLRTRMSQCGVSSPHMSRSCNYKGSEQQQPWHALERLPEDVMSPLGLMWVLCELSQWKAADSQTRLRQIKFLDQLVSCAPAIVLVLLPGRRGE